MGAEAHPFFPLLTGEWRKGEESACIYKHSGCHYKPCITYEENDMLMHVEGTVDNHYHGKEPSAHRCSEPHMEFSS